MSNVGFPECMIQQVELYLRHVKKYRLSYRAGTYAQYDPLCIVYSTRNEMRHSLVSREPIHV